MCVTATSMVSDGSRTSVARSAFVRRNCAGNRMSFRSVRKPFRPSPTYPYRLIGLITVWLKWL